MKMLTKLKTHYENIPIEILWKFYHQKTENFQIKNSDIIHISAQDIDCGYSLELPQWGSTNAFPHYMFLNRNKKNNVYPYKPQFYYIKVGLRGSKLYRHVFMMSWNAKFHYENTPIQIYWKFHYQNWKFSDKNSDTFHISAPNTDCGYSLEPPHWGSSNEYPQSMCLSRNKKSNIYPCKPQFYYIKVGFKGSNLYRYVFVMSVPD